MFQPCGLHQGRKTPVFYVPMGGKLKTYLYLYICIHFSLTCNANYYYYYLDYTTIYKSSGDI